MFRATLCPSSGEITLSMQHWVFFTLCGWLSGMQGGMKPPCIPESSIQSDKQQVSHRHSYFSCWWSHSRPKRTENINKHTKKIVYQVGFTYKITIIHFAIITLQININNNKIVLKVKNAIHCYNTVERLKFKKVSLVASYILKGRQTDRQSSLNIRSKEKRWDLKTNKKRRRKDIILIRI